MSRLFTASSKTKPQTKTLVIKTLKQAEVFSDTLMLHACFQVLVDFVEGNHLFDKSSLIEPKWREVYRLYTYWKSERPRWVHEESVAREYNDRLEAAEIEERRKEKDQEMLARLIKIRTELTI